jgi:hypothetical protein
MGLKDGNCTKETDYNPYEYEDVLDSIFGHKKYFLGENRKGGK